MPTCLVTGGAGFIGSHLVRHLWELGHRVVVVDDLSAGERSSVPPGVTFVPASVCDTAAIDGVFTHHDVDFVYHFAAFAAIGLSHYAKRTNYRTNVDGSVNLISAAARQGVRRFVFASSTAVYGRGGGGRLTEGDQPDPIDSYGLAKWAIERELKLTSEQFDLDFVCLRLHNVYGEGQRLDDPYRNVVGIFMNQVMRGEPLSVYGDGEQTRAYTYVRDIVSGIARSATAPAAGGLAMNLGTSQVHSILQLADLARQALGRPDHPIEFLSARPEVTHLSTSSSLARSVLGAWPETPLSEGLRRTAAWARTRGPSGWRRSNELDMVTAGLPGWLRDRV